MTLVGAPSLRALCVCAASVLVLGGCTQLGLFTLNAAAGFERYSHKIDIPYGPNAANRLDVYLPAHPDHSPVVVFFFGGGWNAGDKSDYKFVGAALADAGFIAVLPNYSLYPASRFPAYMNDAARAVAWARSNVPTWGGDPGRLYVAGHSAGAQIAILLALDGEYLEQVGGTSHWLRGAIGLAGPYDFLPFSESYLADLFGPPARFPSSQPINFVRADAPPILLMCGLQDRKVSPRNTRHLAAALEDVGAHVETRYFDTAGHADLVTAFSKLPTNHLPVVAEIGRFVAESASPR